MNITQCLEITAKQTFAMYDSETSMRKTTVKAGDKFWIASTSVYAGNFGLVEVCRKGKARCYCFAVIELAKLFE
jgi:hypothetical protein